VRASRRPERWPINSATASRVHRNPRQAELIGRGLADPCHQLLLPGFGAGGLLTRSAAAALGSKPGPATSRERRIQRLTALWWTPDTRAASAWVLASSTAGTARLRSAARAAAGNDRLSPSVLPGAYDTITPFAYRNDKISEVA
jgi:hypothetical protein